MGTMLQYGATVSKEFAKAYLMKPEYATMHDNGTIHIHDMDFLAMGTTTCCQINLERLFKNGFDTGHGFVRPPQDISTYGSLAAIVVQANQNDQHGGQAIPALDYYLAPGVLKTFKKQFKQTMYDFLDLEGFLPVINMDRIVRVGTDTGQNNLKSRMSQHFTNENKDRSIFRKNIGRAILNKNNSSLLNYWNLDLTEN